MGIDMKIRRATPSDLEGIAAIQAESWQDSYTEVLPVDFLAGQLNHDIAMHWNAIQIKKEDIVLVAEEDALTGFAAVWCRPVPFIDNLHVRPSHRSQKIGSALMQAVAKELIENGHKTAFLWVFESNQKAIRFYERLGGILTEQSIKTVFGYDVSSRKIEWDDLTLICKNE